MFGLQRSGHPTAGLRSRSGRQESPIGSPLAWFATEIGALWRLLSLPSGSSLQTFSTPMLVLLAAVGSHRARLGMRRLSTALCLVRVDNSGQCVRRGNFMCCRLSLSLCLSWCSHRARRSVVQGRQQQQQVRHVRVPERHADRGERTQEEVLEVGAHATDRRARVVCACGQTCALKLYIKAKPIDGNVKPPPPPKPPETPNGSCPYPPWWGPSRHATPHIAVAPQKYHTPKVP